MAATPRPQPTQSATTVTRHAPHRPKRFHTPAEIQGGASRRQVRQRRRRTVRRVLAGVAALALAATGALAAAPGTAHADAHRDGQWYLDDFNIDKIHELSQGEGVTIGVIDSGIDADHPDLKGNIEEGIEFDANSKTDGDGLTDTIGHGTAVTSVLAGHGHGQNNQDGILGIAPKATIIPAKFDWEKHSNSADHQLDDAIDYFIEQNVNIITTSMSITQSDSSKQAIEKANNKGIAFVAAVGNQTRATYGGGTTKTRDTAFPAKAKGVIPVAGTNQNHKSWEESAHLKEAAPQPQLGLSAPATNIPIAMPNGKYDTVDGTSFSTPIVAGTLALIKSAYPNLEYARMVDRLIETVDDKGEEGFDDKYGWGIVNPYKALTEETTYTGLNNEKQISSPDDRLALNEQGAAVDNHPPGTNPESTGTPDTDDEAAAEAPGPPAWVTIAIITAGALLTAALITLVITKTRRGKKNPPPPGTGPPPHGHPGQSGPTPPTSPPPHFHANPATQQPPGSTPPPQQHNPGHTPPPMAHGPATPQAPGALPPNTPQTPPHQPGQPDPTGTPPPPTGDSPWQSPHDPNTNPPPHQPPQ